MELNIDLSKGKKKKLYVAERIKAYTLIGIGVVCYIYTLTSAVNRSEP